MKGGAGGETGGNLVAVLPVLEEGQSVESVAEECSRVKGELEDMTVAYQQAVEDLLRERKEAEERIKFLVNSKED